MSLSKSADESTDVRSTRGSASRRSTKRCVTRVRRERRRGDDVADEEGLEEKEEDEYEVITEVDDNGLVVEEEAEDFEGVTFGT